jgi:hypothetical protein
MLSFFLPFIHRALSGFQSMYGYSKNTFNFVLASIIMCLYPLIVYDGGWLYLLFLSVNISIVYMKTMSFKLLPKVSLLEKYEDIHLWENLVTGGYVLYLVLAHYNILLIMCSVYPALILHKGFINIGSKLSFFATATDDPTGKTYGFKLFGLKIKRTGNAYRFTMAILSIVAAIIIYLLNWNILIPNWY